MPDEKQREVNLSEVDLSAFADKLDKWADSLPADERGLVQYLLARAEASTSRELVTLEGDELTTAASPGTLAEKLLREVLERGVTSVTGPGDEGARMARPCTWSTWSRGVEP